MLIAAVSIFKVNIRKLCSAFEDLWSFFKSILHIVNCFFALANNYSFVLILLATKNTEISLFCSCYFLC